MSLTLRGSKYLSKFPLEGKIKISVALLLKKAKLSKRGQSFDFLYKKECL